MIITRTPLRISLGGGGTDLPSYSDHHGGMVISAAIDRYMFISVNKSFGEDYLLKYSKMERVKTIEEIEHPIIRETLRRHHLPPGYEIVSVADGFDHHPEPGFAHDVDPSPRRSDYYH